MPFSSMILALNEELSNVPLQVKGNIPTWLSGTLIRNGPIQVSINGKQNDHWFDGLAMLHAFAFHNGQVTYTNQFLRTDAYRKVFEEGSLDYPGFAYDPCRALFKRFLSLFQTHSSWPLYNANVNVSKVAENYIAMTETPLPVRFDPKTLETLGVLNYQDELLKDKCFESAHPHHDSQKKETINYLVEYGFSSTYCIYRIKEGSQSREILAKIPVKEPSYMHSFSVTQNYIILVEYPFLLDPLTLIFGSKAFIHNYTWRSNQKTRFLMIERSSGKLVKTYESDPFFAFHHVNAYEKEGKVILDLIAYRDASVIEGLANHDRIYKTPEEQKRDVENFNIRMLRFQLPLDSADRLHINPELLVEQVLELPRVNDRYDGREYRYAYAANAKKMNAPDEYRELYKVDVQAKTYQVWREKGCGPGEAVFVSAPGATKEDEGVVLSLVLDEFHQKSFLLILNAETFREIGRAEVTHAIPQGLHGQWY